MRRAPLLCLPILIAAACGDPEAPPPPSREPPPGSARFGVFEGKVPCADCQRVKVRLTLHRGALDQSPTAYVLERVDVGSSNERLVATGTWATSTGSKVAPGGLVATLAASPDAFARYLLLGDDLLLLLDAGLEPRVGNAEHSFTLSRTE